MNDKRFETTWRDFAVRRGCLVFLAGLFFAYCMVLFGIAGVRDPGHAGRSVVRVVASVVELGFVGILLAACMRLAGRRPGWRRAWLALAWSIAAAITFAYLGQTYSLYLSGNFVTPLALDNPDSASFIASPTLLVASICAIAWWALYCLSTLLPRKARRRREANFETIGRGAFVACFCVLALLFAYLSTLQRKGAALAPGFRQAPMLALGVAVHDAEASPSSLPEETESSGHCFQWSERGADYPFQKSTVYGAQIPLSSNAPHGRPNMIVFMSEGVAARMLGAYGGRHKALTPNIDRFASSAMRVDDYFNHTAATYRGIAGQLSSGFTDWDGGGKNGWERVADPSSHAAIRRQTVPAILSANGWTTTFLAPHREKKPIILMLRSLGFDSVYSGDTITSEFLGGKASKRRRTAALEDQSLLLGLRRFLEHRPATDRKPFFVATYNIGTHAFIPPGPVRYGAADNPVLDKLHNYDAAFGDFMAWFQASRYASDTIVVFTADHTTYPEPAYRKVAGSDLRPYFVDRIPLLIHDPFHDLPSALDAKGRTSIDLAPTLLQLLGAPQASNAFLGRSLFEPRSMPLGIASIGRGLYFLTTPAGALPANQVPADASIDFKCEVGVVARYYAAERENRIFEPIPERE